jgi:hypothetical protein
VIYGILSYGTPTSFEFFSFNGGAKPPIFSRGVLRTTPSSDPHLRLTIADYESTSEAVFIRSLRPICETIFYFLLLAYKAGVDAHTEQSVKNGIKDLRPGESYLSWADAQEQAGEALTLAVDTATKAFARDDVLSIDQKTEKAFEHLRQRCEFPRSGFHLTSLNTLFKHSLVAVPAFYKNKREINLLRAWDEEDFTYC